LPQAPYDQDAPLKDKSRVRLASSPLLLLKTEADKVSFNACGKNHSVPLYVKPALELLRDDRAIPLAQLCGAVDGESAVANLKRGLAMLASAGVVLVEEWSRHKCGSFASFRMRSDGFAICQTIS
jgi:hypothetical protein